MTKFGRVIVWSVPLALYCGDALAWGLYTHFYFAQLLLWAVPLADPHFRRAVRRFPGLLLAGACLPDVALFSSHARASELRVTHQWSAAHRLLRAATDDAERALAVGYSSHLLTDVIAHNHFVPAHEALWFDARIMTHAAAEWAMDAHIASHVFARPAHILERYLDVVAAYTARHFDCDITASRRAALYLLRGERTLRNVRLAQALYHGARALDRTLMRRFDYYARETAARLAQIDRIIDGDAPVWRPEVECARQARDGLRVQSVGTLAFRVPLPSDLFRTPRGSGIDNGVSDKPPAASGTP